MATNLRVRPTPDTAEMPAAELRVVGDPLIGQAIGAYRLVSLLGEGGMGRVYLGQHTVIGRKAAIKVLAPEIASDAEAVSRFFVEARAVNDIRHPNIVEVTDFGQFGGYYAIVMELLEGETLAARLARARTLDAKTVVRIIGQCASALAAAHDRGFVHRDIKPENIFLREHPDYPDFVKLLDFGIAKLLAPTAEISHRTKTGSLLGTPTYMSPEQCLGESSVDVRSDIYSLGIVMYQMLTGRVPFEADTLGRLIVCHVSELPLPPMIANASVPRAVNDVVLRALRKKPQDRYATVRDLREALDVALTPARAQTPASALAPVALAAVGSGPIRAGSAAGGGVVVGKAGVPASGPVSGSGPNAAIVVGARTPIPNVVEAPRPPSISATAGAAAQLATRLAGIVRERVAEGRVDLPKLPGTIAQCRELAARGNLSFADAARIVSQQPALRSRVMRLANSAAFPSLMPATTIEQAVARLGMQGLSQALLEFAARDVLESAHARVREGLRRIWPHSLGVALMTSELCQTVGAAMHVQNGYIAGLLHDVGRPVVGAVLVDIDLQMQRAAGRHAPMAESVLLAAIEGSHRDAGAALARSWDLPGAAVYAIESAGTWDDREPKSLGNIVTFASALCDRLGLGLASATPAESERLVGEGRARLGIDDRLLKSLGHGFKERVVVLATLRG